MAITAPPSVDPTVPVAAQRARRPRGNQQPRLDTMTRVIVALVVLVLVVLIGVPLWEVLRSAASREGLEVAGKMATSSVHRTILLNTIILGVVVGAIGTIVGFLFAYAQARLEFRGKKLLHLIALMPIVSPPFAVATAVITLFGRSGIVTHGWFGWWIDIYGLPGLTIVLALSFFPVSYMNLLGMLNSLDPSLDEASSNLGANKWRIFRTVTLPMLIPGFASSFLLLFVEAIADLANPLVIGGDFTVLASRAYIAITGEYDVPSGAAYSVVLLLPAVLVFLVQRYWVGKRSVVSVTGKPTGRHQMVTGFWGRAPLLLVIGFISLIIVMIYVTVFLGGFVKILGVNNTFTLDNFRYVLGGIGSDAIVDTTIMALIATPIAGVLGMVIAWLVVRKLRRGAALLDFGGMLGLAVPGTVIGIGYAIAFNHPQKMFGVEWLPALAGGGAIFGGSLAIIMVYTIRSMPTGLRNGISSLQQIDPSIDEASAALGASGLVTFRKVTLPLIRPALLAGLTYAFARSMTTLSPIIFITTPQTRIMTSQILNEVDAGRFGNAFAFCTLLILIVMTVIGLLNLAVHGRGSAVAIGGGA